MVIIICDERFTEKLHVFVFFYIWSCRLYVITSMPILWFDSKVMDGHFVGLYLKTSRAPISDCLAYSKIIDDHINSLPRHFLCCTVIGNCVTMPSSHTHSLALSVTNPTLFSAVDCIHFRVPHFLSS